jgi:hypothetical protein
MPASTSQGPTNPFPALVTGCLLLKHTLPAFHCAYVAVSRGSLLLARDESDIVTQSSLVIAKNVDGDHQSRIESLNEPQILGSPHVD